MTTFHPGGKDDVNQTRSETSPVVETTEVSVLFLTKDLLFSSRVAGVAEHGVTLVDAYVTLGHYDIVAIIEAPDTEAAAAASALIAAQGNFRAETLPATPVADFLQRVGGS